MGFMLWKLKAVSQIGFNELVQPLQAVRTNLSISICNNIKIKDLIFFFTSFNFVVTFITVT
jgi:hypothetical protein